MYKWVLVCLVAVAVTKWSQNVQATDDLDDEEKRLLQTLDEILDQNQGKRDAGMDCGTEECFRDDDCAYECCQENCDGETDFDGCMDACMNGQTLSKRMALAARNQERTNEAVNNNNNKHQKKIWGIPPVRRWVPPIPPVRRWVPPIPPVRRWVPPVPPVRRWVPPVPRVRRWFGKK